jgi:hypothetical protein
MMASPPLTAVRRASVTEGPAVVATAWAATSVTALNSEAVEAMVDLVVRGSPLIEWSSSL